MWGSWVGTQETELIVGSFQTLPCTTAWPSTAAGKGKKKIDTTRTRYGLRFSSPPGLTQPPLVCSALGHGSLSLRLIQDAFEARLSISQAGTLGRLALDLHSYLQRLLQKGKLIVVSQCPGDLNAATNCLLGHRGTG